MEEECGAKAVSGAARVHAVWEDGDWGRKRRRLDRRRLGNRVDKAKVSPGSVANEAEAGSDKQARRGVRRRRSQCVPVARQSARVGRVARAMTGRLVLKEGRQQPGRGVTPPVLL